MTDQPHPSEPLLTVFSHGGLVCQIPQSLHPVKQNGLIFQGLALLMLLGTGAALLFGNDGLVGASLIGAGTFELLPLTYLGVWNFKTRTTKIEIDPTHLTLTSTTYSGRQSDQKIELATIESAYVIKGTPGTGAVYDRLRIVHSDGKDTIVFAHLIPEASADWLATQISHVARQARERAAGEAAPEILEMLDASSRAEAKRKMQLSQRQSSEAFGTG